MKVLLDTNICIYIIRRKPPEVHRKFETYKVGDVGVSSVTVAELMFGAEKGQHREKNLGATEQFLLPLVVVPFDYDAAVVYGRVRSDLERKSTPIGPLDLMIAAHALHLRLPLVTNNVREFARVKGLTVENWVA